MYVKIALQVRYFVLITNCPTLIYMHMQCPYNCFFVSTHVDVQLYCNGILINTVVSLEPLMPLEGQLYEFYNAEVIVQTILL